VRTCRITLKREILIEDEKREQREEKNKEKRQKKNFHRSYDVAGVTVIWNSPLPPVADDVPAAVVVVREVDDGDGEGDEDVGMS
jgi:hypothetical protein